MTDREQINSLAKEVSDYADEIVALKQENNELKKRVAELEKPKKKRKFRAMTVREWCNSKKCSKCEYRYGLFHCIYSDYNITDLSQFKEKPFKKRNGKYILVEVTE